MKAQGLSINTIIIAAIALIVLVVLIAVFTGRIGIFGEQLNDQTNQKCPGEVRESNECGITDTIYGAFSEIEAGQVCCRSGAADPSPP